MVASADEEVEGAGALAKAPSALEEEEGAEVEEAEGALEQAQEVEEGLLLQPVQEEEEVLQPAQEEEALVEEGQPAQEEEELLQEWPPPLPRPARGRAAAALPPHPSFQVRRSCSIVGQIEW